MNNSTNLRLLRWVRSREEKADKGEETLIGLHLALFGLPKFYRPNVFICYEKLKLVYLSGGPAGRTPRDPLPRLSIRNSPEI